jgi:hypothetical protein
MAFPDDRIAFPIANALPALHPCWALINRDLIGNPPPTVIGSIAFPPCFLTAQKPVQIPAIPFVLINLLVDPFMADARTVFALHSAADLLGAPGLCTNPSTCRQAGGENRRPCLLI